jgi:hypothetical protein
MTPTLVVVAELATCTPAPFAAVEVTWRNGKSGVSAGRLLDNLDDILQNLQLFFFRLWTR